MPPKPVNTSDNSPARMKAKRISLSTRAGLILPVCRIHQLLKKGNYAPRIGKEAVIYMTAAIEYLCIEILDLAAKAAEDNHRTKISPRHILLAIRNDEELAKMLRHMTIVSGGVLPHIEPELLPKKTMKRQQTPNSS